VSAPGRRATWLLLKVRHVHIKSRWWWSSVARIIVTELCLAMPAAVGQSDAMQLSAAANAPCVEALYRFRLPTPTEAGRAPLTGGPNSASLLPRAELSKQILTAAASKEVGA